ncbi:hypothetical protein [Streptomyces sp. NPDC060194]|uniref:hypothetical protein n=1 Tax=Streptomyces sp. NPDC060194 TaxID=3347069 RepID=UPI0036481955
MPLPHSPNRPGVTPLPTLRSVGRPAGRLLAPALLAASFAVQAIAAFFPQVPLLIAATVAGLLTEGFLHRRRPDLVAALAKVRADTTARQILRDFLLVAGLLRLEGQQHETAYLPLVYGLLVFYGLHFGCQAAALLVRRSRTLPVVTRNIDTSALRLTPAPPALLLRRANRRILLFGAPATAGLLATAATNTAWCAAAGIAVSVAVTAAGLVALLVRLLPSRRPSSQDEVLEWFENWLAEYRPTTGMYFSGGTSSAYQANMWLEPLAKLEGRPVIVLRERFMMQRIAATDIPVVCLPKVAHLMRLEHSTLQTLIHPANSGKTSQVLRIPTIKHAFVNHGESDKLSSCNPYAKAYDEVWVAGPAARERYALAEVGVDDRDVVEIGRPQLDAVGPYAGPPAGAYTNVLYAPTWEGWDGNPGNTSVVLAGENIVRELLADPAVRLVYKPHPMTGSVDPAAGAANLRIQAMIADANRARGGQRPPAGAADELARRTQELERLTTASFRTGADEAERMLLQSAPEPGRAEAVAAATAAWEAAYQASLPEWEHQVVTTPRPSIFACFNAADVLVSDVSSVVSDYLASDKPYAVANTSGLSEAAFREQFPTVRAATVLTPDGAGVPALLDAVRHPERDAFRAARAELKLRLLGPSDPPSATRFADAARELGARARRHQERMALRAAAEIPAQRGSAEAEHVAEELELEASQA